jgi:hypothetical protein
MPKLIEAPLLIVKLHSHVGDWLVSNPITFSRMTVLPLHPLAQVAPFVKQKLTPNVTANVSALSLDARAWVTLAFKKFCCFENTIAAR